MYINTYALRAMPVMWIKDVDSDKGRSLSVFEEWLNDLLPSAAELEV
jgi:hypothetical protein